MQPYIVTMGASPETTENLLASLSIDIYGFGLPPEDPEPPLLVAYGEDAVTIARANYARRYPQHVTPDDMRDWELAFSVLLGVEHLVPLPEIGHHCFAPHDFNRQTSLRFMEMH